MGSNAIAIWVQVVYFDIFITFPTGLKWPQITELIRMQKIEKRKEKPENVVH